MAADNDNCLFFWWVTSTVRHLGIGGQYSNKTIEPSGGLPPFDPEKRLAAYQQQMNQGDEPGPDSNRGYSPRKSREHFLRKLILKDLPYRM